MRPLLQGSRFVVVGLLMAGRLAAQGAEPPGVHARRDATVSSYCAAWSEREPGKRDSLLRDVWADDGVYSDPTPISLQGREKLSTHIGGFLRENVGAHFRCSAAQGHHDSARFGWTILGASGSQLMSGMDFVEFAADGRLRRIVGFFGQPPSISGNAGQRSATFVPGADVASLLRQVPAQAVSDRQIRMVNAGGYNVGIGAVSRPQAATQTGIEHDKLTEVYVVLEGAGTLVTGGTLTNAVTVAPTSAIYRELTGPSTVGTAIQGGESRRLAAGDVVIIPSGVAHWFSGVQGSIKYLVVRIDPDRLLVAR